jgi:hypothetical protein
MLTIKRLIWDDWNVEHIARHDVSPEEVEEVCQQEPMVDQTYAGRLRLIGETDSGRDLTVILAPKDEPGVYYPITARPASVNERLMYREEVIRRDQEAA